MKSLTNTLSFYASIVVYLIFNLRLQANAGGGIDALSSLQATALQIAQTAPYVAGFTYFVIAVLQYMSGGDKLPWDRRARLFMAFGILGGLFLGIYEYAGVVE